MSSFHLLRPWWLLTFIPLVALYAFVLRQSPLLDAWSSICDRHLLNQLLQKRGQKRRKSALLFLFVAITCMIIALSGPTWSFITIPTYQSIQPSVVILDMSESMLSNDLPPDRLTRAKFKLHDLFKVHDTGQLALIVYSGEPFVVSPLTDDAQTIDAMIDFLNPTILPVSGESLGDALQEAGNLISEAGFKQGQILVLTGVPPNTEAIKSANKLAKKKIYTSVIPLLPQHVSHPLFANLAKAGLGQLIPFTDTTKDLTAWLDSTQTNKKFSRSEHNEVVVWRDQGRWFLIPGLIFLLPVFQRGWLRRVCL